MELVQGSDLGITAPDSFYCKVWGFRYSHSLMLIRASKGDLLTGETIYLMFGEVHYFEGPTNWKGAGFHFGGREEIISLIQRMLVQVGDREYWCYRDVPDALAEIRT